MGFKLRRPPFGPVQRGPNRIQLVEIENRSTVENVARLPSTNAPISTILPPDKTSKLLVSKSIYATMAPQNMTGSLGKRIVCIRQNLAPLRSGSATKRPAESRMLLEDVIRHGCPDLVVPQHRTAAIDRMELRWLQQKMLETKTTANV